MMQSSLPSKTIKNSKKKATDTSHKKSAYGLVTPFVIFFIVTILIWNPLEVGCKKLFIQCEYGTAETRCIWSVINRRDI